ncbi:MAG: 3-dehydroquinate synthase [Propionivibrio sp.]
METLNVALGDRSYPIHIGSGAIRQMELLLPLLVQPKVAVVTNEVVAPIFLRGIARELRDAGIQVVEIVLPDGERYKDWQTLNTIFDALIANSCERNTTLVALGGGVVGDMTGFAAACYQRGAPFVQIPTTLLAQVDSSVGGKTAINHPRGKNMIGAFYQPKLVLADPDTLASLPDRELRSGLAEVIKYGLIRDLPFLEWLENHLEDLLRKDPESLEKAIYHACKNKAEIVAADERELGERALLNLGHTFGHAIEAGVGYGRWLHGEAVAAGTMMAIELSRLLGWLGERDVDRAEALFKRAGLPVAGPAMEVGRYMELMQHDKKVQDGKLRLVLLRDLGKAVVSDVASSAEIGRAIEARAGRG